MMTLRDTEGLKVIDTLAFLRKYRFFVIAFILWALIIIPWNITSLIMLSSNGTQAGWHVFLFQCTTDTHLGGKYLILVSSRSVKMREFSFLSLHAF